MRSALCLLFGALSAVVSSGFTLGFRSSVSAQVSAAPGYGPKTQIGAEAALDAVFGVTDWFEIGFTAGILGAGASNLDGGYGYRAYHGGFAGVVAAADAAIASRPDFGILLAGGRLAVLADIARYGNTSLAFFFPGIGLDGTLSFVPAGLPAMRVDLAVPLRVFFRRDLRFSVSAGLGLGIHLTSPARPAREASP